MEHKDRRRLKDQRARYHAALKQALLSIVAQLREMPEVERVILFGSNARGRADLLTDLDLIVVMRSDKPFVERTAELYRRIEAPVDLDMLVYTPDEIQAMKDRGFLRKALREGKVLYEKKSA
jgi:predicted nucleotidyltransferase